MAEDLVKVAWARDPAEGALMRGLLENAGIPSLLRPEVPDGPKLGFGLLNPAGGAGPRPAGRNAGRGTFVIAFAVFLLARAL